MTRRGRRGECPRDGGGIRVLRDIGQKTGADQVGRHVRQYRVAEAPCCAHCDTTRQRTALLPGAQGDDETPSARCVAVAVAVAVPR